jgi:hypothetical protein
VVDAGCPQGGVGFTRRDVQVGPGPGSVTVGDFNEDGHQDLATANFEGHSVSILLGRGDGTFQPAQDFGVEGFASSVTVGDFNEDGHQDLALATPQTAEVGPDSVSVLLGRGDGTFQVTPAVGVGDGPVSITVGDFNEDGHQDLATANEVASTMSILINTPGIAVNVVNDLVSFEPIPSTFQFTPDPAGCPVVFVGTFSFEARLSNTSENSLTALVVVVTTLTNGNLLQNADGGPGGVGAQLTVPQQDGFADGVLNAEEFVDVPFVICLTAQAPFTYVVDVFGVSDASTDAQARVQLVR